METFVVLTPDNLNNSSARAIVANSHNKKFYSYDEAKSFADSFEGSSIDAQIYDYEEFLNLLDEANQEIQNA